MSIGMLLLSGTALAASSMMSAKPAAPSAADKAAIASAMLAAPAAISSNATVVAPDATGKMRILRKGANGFTCMPDDPSSPGVDPMCADKPAMAWLDAWAAHKVPAKQVGFIYMLAGGSDASNTDPYATKPAAGANWVTTAAHVMVVGADTAFYAAYPGGANPDTSKPYIMWAGTPYQHLMAPVK
ncbi:MAG: hypothetical protein JO261_00840 [Alphaproteobacteria bacterium]|nr:hypothetical protein [Alphaproteobacteria bacterium]MBV9692221.1 hypothetical protein [Alphaproteobacteria bacterium]